jgi:hypothetical protein
MKDLHALGAKDDSEKPRAGLVLRGFRNALMEVSRVGTFGAKKYTDHGWLYVPNGEERYDDALFRHLLSGDVDDDESKLPHLAHAAWNALAELELYLRRAKNGNDFAPKSGRDDQWVKEEIDKLKRDFNTSSKPPLQPSMVQRTFVPSSEPLFKKHRPELD